jgi:hypothetical protein
MRGNALILAYGWRPAGVTGLELRRASVLPLAWIDDRKEVRRQRFHESIRQCAEPGATTAGRDREPCARIVHSLEYVRGPHYAVGKAKEAQKKAGSEGLPARSGGILKRRLEAEFHAKLPLARNAVPVDTGGGAGSNQVCSTRAEASVGCTARLVETSGAVRRPYRAA